MTRPPDGGDGSPDDEGSPTPDDDAPARDRDKQFDEVWQQLPTTDVSTRPAGATKLWDDDARMQPREASDENTPPEDEADASASSRTKLGHPGVAGIKPPPAVAAAEMDKLMRGAMPSVPSDQSGIRPQVLLEEDERARRGEPGAEDGDDGDDGAESRADDDDAKLATVTKDETPGLRVVPDVDAHDDDDDDDARVDAPSPAAPVAAAATASAPRRAVAVRPEPPAASADEVALSSRAKLLIGLVGAAAIVGVGWAMAGSSVPNKDKPSIQAPPAAPIPPTGQPRRPPPGTPPSVEPVDAATGTDGGDSDSSGNAPDAPRTGDPRQPPSGTTPEAADAFSKIPVSPADRPPVGGIGASGIHVDRITVGSQYENQDCAGKTDEFSVAAGDRVSVCVRLVHQREKEEVVVLWQKEGGAARRGKMIVKGSHAYRTRAYLMLREEYVGEWTVRILSEDEVELAAQSFTVVE